MIRSLLLSLLVLASPLALAEVHEVKMLNRGASGSMVYEPDFLKIAPGDSVKFIASHTSHNAASIPGLLPEGATPFKGALNQEVEVSFAVPGYYGIQCIPHLMMGMVMLIQVGEPQGQFGPLPASLPRRAQERFAAIAERASVAH
jgi:pseudoazurin